MSFPQTRLTLIQRLAAGGSEDDWRTFVRDYWGPVCRFALRWGAPNADDAEDVASETFELLWRNRLFVRWLSNRSAKLRTLLCGVVRNQISNRARVRAGRERIMDDLAEQFDEWTRQGDEQPDLFYAAWVEDLAERAVKSLASDYGRQGKGDYLRVLYGRVCQDLTIAQCADSLGLRPATVDNYYRHARDRLGEKLEALLRRQIERYSPTDDVDQELAAEWNQLGLHLAAQGGLEAAVRRAHEQLDPARLVKRREAALTKTFERPTDAPREPPDPHSGNAAKPAD